MGYEKNLIKTLPRTSRDIKQRKESKDSGVVEISRRFGFDYFDGDRKYGYGGYYYDGRWLTVAKSLIQEYSLTAGMTVLDVGCAKGFLVKDLMISCPGLEVFGIDVSDYALLKADPKIVGRLHLGSAEKLPFPNEVFDLVISINTLHNLEQNQIITALSEIQRVSKRNSYIVVDSYRNSYEKEIFLDWVLTTKFHEYPQGWIDLFAKAGYTGDYYWTIINERGENE
jgi:ubiquinone/menaquinone biosynthesis C-methylase UbiE